MKKIFFAMLALMILSNTAVKAELMTAEKLWSLKRIGEPMISPNGKNILFTISQPDISENNSTIDIYLIPITGGDYKKMTSGGKHNYNPVWSPNGNKFVFISDRNKTPQAFILDLNGGEAIQITKMENGVSCLDWSPDGKYLSFVSEVKLDSTLVERNPDIPKVNARVYTSLPVRHWDSWIDETYSHLFIQSIDGGTAKDLMPNDKFDTPLKPFGGGNQIAWSPDGKEIAYTCKKVDRFAESTNSSIYTVEIENGKTTDITPNLPGYDMEPLYSPNGKYIAFKSMQRAGFEADKDRLMIYSRGDHSITDITEKIDLSVDKMLWEPSTKGLYFIANEKGTVKVFHIKLDNQEYKSITSGTYNYADQGIELSPDGKMLVLTKRNMNRPAELYTLKLGKELDEKQLTDVNGNEYKNIDLATIEERWITSTDGKKVHCWVVLPPNFDKSKKYPVITYCQGGPQQAITQYFSYGWNFLLMASKGYVIIAPNRRGAPGFGQDWVDAISKDWGGGAMQDILAATDDLCKENYIKKDGLSAIGGSAGGFTTFWLEGNHNKRFKAFVSHCGVFDLESMYGSTEELWFTNWDYAGPYWDKTAKLNYDRFSPHVFADKWDTPILITTGEKDFRVPYTQSLEAFTVAQVKGIPSELIVYPEENHFILHPQEQILWYRQMFNFLDKYCK